MANLDEILTCVGDRRHKTRAEVAEEGSSPGVGGARHANDDDPLVATHNGGYDVGHGRKAVSQNAALVATKQRRILLTCLHIVDQTILPS